jgi:hypothetical protein
MARFFRTVVMIVLWAANGYAQFDSAEVLGLIKDGSGAVLVQTDIDPVKREHWYLGNDC